MMDSKLKFQIRNIKFELRTSNLSLSHPQFTIAIDFKEQIMVGRGLLNDGLKLREIGWVNHCMHVLLKRLHRVECLAIAANQNRDRIATLNHRHLMELFEGQIFLRGAGSKSLFDNYD